jgi:hypothetical protein
MNKAQVLEAQIGSDETLVKSMIAMVIAAGGRKWGVEEAYIVEFDDGSYYSAAVFEPEHEAAYFNGSAKLDPTK